jgi:peptide/nickel transport system substrate-binding protein
MKEDFQPFSLDGLSRRDVLKRGAGTGLALSAASLLAACGSSGSSQTQASTKVTEQGLTALLGGTPRSGGTATVGVLSGGSAENIWPGTAGVTPDFARDYNLYNLLFYIGQDVKTLLPGLAVAAESNKDATLWTFHLRDGVEWHDGKSLTADDLVYNFQALWVNATDNFGSAFLTDLVDFKAVRKRGQLVVDVPLKQACAQFPSIFTFYTFGLVPVGATAKAAPTNPIGTGPFKFESFSAGSRSVFTRNPNYWEGGGKPYFDELVIDSSFTDNNALLDALLGGQIDLFPNIPLLSAKNQIASKQSQILQAEIATIQYMHVMRVDKGPFADNRVRTAFKLLADRQAMVDGAFAGFGVPAYDLLAPATEYFLSDLTRQTDVEKAKSLLKAAGAADEMFVLPIAEVFPGMVEGATLFAQQAQAAGINVVIKETSVSTYFTPAGGFITRPFAEEVDQVVPSLTVDYLAELAPGAPYPETHWGSQPGGAAALKLISQAIGEPNPSTASDLWRECQLQQYNEGGYLVWGNVPFVDAASEKVRGLRAGPGYNYDKWRLCDGWFAA